MSQIALLMLGALRVFVDGQQVTGFESNKVKALLAYLAVEADRSHARRQLAGMLWPNSPEQTALRNLRHVLTSLRQVIGDYSASPQFLLVDRAEIGFNPACSHDSDVARFAELVTTNLNDAADVQQLRQALELYRGDFLDELDLDGCEAFGEWTLFKREYFGQLHMSALRTLCAYYERVGDYDQAESYARCQLYRDPWDEVAHQQLMRALALAGHRCAALRQFDKCLQLLRDGLGVKPGAAVTALYQRICDGTFGATESMESGNGS